MDGETYVVHSIGSEIRSPFKAFAKEPAARAFAESQVHGLTDVERADIYRARCSDVRLAVAAVQMGEAELIGSRGVHASPEELHRHFEREWKLAIEGGPQAILKFLGQPIPESEKPAVGTRRR